MNDQTPFVESMTGEDEIFGVKLREFSASREIAARAMGLIYPFIGEEGTAQLDKTNTYPRQLPDAIITLWVCSLPDPKDLSPEEAKNKAWTPSKAARAPAGAMEVAIEWAVGLGFASLVSPKFGEATTKAALIINDYMAAKYTVAESEKGEEPGNL